MHKIFDDLCSERGKYLNYDFYIEDRKTLIEYQGEYHVKQHDKTEESYKNQLNNDALKRNYAIINGYKLLEIWYWDFDNIEQILLNKLKEDN